MLSKVDLIRTNHKPEVLDLRPVFGTCVRDRACGDWLFYIEIEGNAPGGVNNTGYQQRKEASDRPH